MSSRRRPEEDTSTARPSTETLSQTHLDNLPPEIKRILEILHPSEIGVVQEVSKENLSYFDPDGPHADVYHPHEIAKILKNWKEEANLAFFLVGGAARRVALGESVLTDLDLSCFSLDTQNPITSVPDLLSRIAGPDTEQYRTRRAPNCPQWGIIEGEDNIWTAILTLPHLENPIPTSIKLYHLPEGDGWSRRDWQRVWEGIMADVIILPETSIANWVAKQPVEDSLIILLDPQPDQEFPFRAWMIDTNNALSALQKTGGTITYRSPESLLPSGEGNCQEVTQATSKLIRGAKLAQSLNKNIPEGFFLEVAKEIKQVANQVVIQPEDEIHLRLFLEQLYANFTKMMALDIKRGCQHPTPTAELLLGEIAAQLFPNLDRFLNLPVWLEKDKNEEETTLRDFFRHHLYGHEKWEITHYRLAPKEIFLDFLNTMKTRWPLFMAYILKHHPEIITALNNPPNDRDLDEFYRGRASRYGQQHRLGTRDPFYVQAQYEIRADPKGISRLLGIRKGKKKTLTAGLTYIYYRLWDNLLTPFPPENLGKFPGWEPRPPLLTKIVDG